MIIGDLRASSPQIFFIEMRHYNIPIFIPELACPNRCVYCNQRHISGQLEPVTTQQVRDIIEQHLSCFKYPCEVELAFFGGSFTGLKISEQEEYLATVQPYIKQGQISSIRLSTRPDYIDTEILDLLKRYNVKTIELGAQSLCDEILQYCERGHSVKDVEVASAMIKNHGFELGLQMMVGLPLDTLERSKQTALKIVELGADNTRIYPTLVIKHTKLAELYEAGLYQPLSLFEAVERTAEIYKIFTANNINILRVGLHPSEGLIHGTELVTGPFHVSFRELVLSKIWHERLLSLPEDCFAIRLNPKDVNYAIGYKACNRKFLKAKNREIEFLQDESIRRDTFVMSRAC